MQVRLEKPRIEVGDRFILRHEVIELLRAIRLHKSIAAAARDRNMEFRTAWGHIQALNEALQKPVAEVVNRPVSGGRGTNLTPLGLALVEHYDRIDEACRNAAKPGVLAIGRVASRD